MKLVRIIGSGLIAACVATGTVWAQDDSGTTAAEEATTVAELVELIREGRTADTATFNQLRQQFVQRQNEQTRLL